MGRLRRFAPESLSIAGLTRRSACGTITKISDGDKNR